MQPSYLEEEESKIKRHSYSLTKKLKLNSKGLATSRMFPRCKNFQVYNNNLTERLG